MDIEGLTRDVIKESEKLSGNERFISIASLITKFKEEIEIFAVHKYTCELCKALEDDINLMKGVLEDTQ